MVPPRNDDGRRGKPGAPKGGPAKRGAPKRRAEGRAAKRSGAPRRSTRDSEVTRGDSTRGEVKGRSKGARTFGTGRPGAARKPSSGGRRERPVREDSDSKKARDAAPKSWGGVARKGAGRLGDAEGRTGASDAWRKAMTRGTPPSMATAPAPKPPPAWEAETWIDEGDVRDRARNAVKRGATRPVKAPEVFEDERPRRKPPAHVAQELSAAVGATSAPRLGERLAEASKQFGRERYNDARRTLVVLAKRAPAAAAVRELLGVTNYRLGRWNDAAKELEAFRALTGSTEQHPVLADTYRALGRYDLVDELWEELRETSPSGELVTEGRIVAAGALADRKRLPEAIALLEAGIRKPKRLAEHHLRLLYALADLYERASETPKARQLFRRIADADPDFADVADRIRSLR